MKTLLLSTLIIFSLFACKAKKGTTKNTKLEDSSWVVTNLGENKPLSNQTLIIEGEKVKGKGACNSFGGILQLSENQKIKLSEIISTKMACDNLQEENVYFEALRNTSNYSIVKDELIFYNSNNKQLVKFKKSK